MVVFTRSLFLTRSIRHKNLYMSACLNSSSENANNPLKGAKGASSTVDPNEVQKHAEIRNVWWDTNGPLKALHSYNEIRVPFVRDGLVQCSPEERTAKPLIGKTILDVGCGGGILSEALARLGAQVTGIDAAKELIEVAQQHCEIDPRLENNRPQYIFTTIEKHAENCKNHYDAVVASEIIEHVNDKELFVKSCVATLKAGGRAFFTTPTRSRLSQLLSIYVAEYVLRLVPRGTHDYDKFITPTELTFLLERNNCHVELIHGILYNPLTNSWKFISFDQILFALQAVKIQ